MPGGNDRIGGTGVIVRSRAIGPFGGHRDDSGENEPDRALFGGDLVNPASESLDAVRLAHLIVRSRLDVGGTAVDATAGNGHDTVFLARLVGATGRVVAVDVQQAAIDSTRRRLDDEGAGGRVTLLRGGHEDLCALLEQIEIGELEAVMFNLGYLPGSDKAVVTGPETTLAALDAAIRLLTPTGVVTVVCYPGHPGGGLEAERVCEWAKGLPRDQFMATVCRSANGPEHLPFLVAVEKRRPFLNRLIRAQVPGVSGE